MIANQVNVTSKTEIANSNKIVKGEDDMIYDFTGYTHLVTGVTQNNVVTEISNSADLKEVALVFYTNGTVTIYNGWFSGNIQIVVPQGQITAFYFKRSLNSNIKLNSGTSINYSVFYK